MNSEAKWFDFYGDVPHTLEYPDISMYAMICNVAEKYGDYVAYDFMGKSATFEEFVQQVDNCAKALAEFGIQPGETVTVCLPNLPQAVIMFYAINKIGAIASMVHPLSAEMRFCFISMRAKAV